MEQEVQLAARIKKGDKEARSQMIRANLRLVVKIAHDYGNLGLPLLDLVSEGNIGLMKAVERFDPAKGGKLSTYAAWWIKQSIKRALANQSKTIRLPVHLVDKIAKIRRVSLSMSEELGREPTDQELADEVGLSAAKLSQLRTVSIRPASLDAPMNDEDGTEFGEIVGDDNAVDPAENLSDKILQEEIADLLRVLDDRERKIIMSRFGLDGGNSRTLEEVGEKFGVTRERIRQLQNIALAKLRRALRKREHPIEHLIARGADAEDLAAIASNN
jgi:RNA polymerase primary sigma factor